LWNHGPDITRKPDFSHKEAQKAQKIALFKQPYPRYNVARCEGCHAE
jgi:hypothetical protein